MKDEIKEILDILKKCYDLKDENFDNYITLYQLGLLLDYITNLQQENERLKENNQNMQEEMARVWEENERLKAQLTDTEWEYQNTRCKYEKQYKKGITEELLEDIETCFFNRENPSMIPIDSLDVCHIFGYIDYLKDYKSRCEKAIKYIKEHYPTSTINDQDDKHNLLNILQNGSDSQ